MLTINKSRKADKELYNNSSENFIPVACHYDENTLLTKNGELIQIIQINGVYAQAVNDEIFRLRDILHKTIAENIPDKNFALWIHTVRRKTDLDDHTEYTKMLSQNIHKAWCEKNYWHDKFTNTLYISIVYSAADIKLKNFNSIINSLSLRIIEDFHYKFLEASCKKLTKIVNKMVTSLQKYGATKLGFEFAEGKCFSQLLFLYRRITHLNDDKCLLPITDLSVALSAHRYAVGSDKIEVVDNLDKNFTSILSLREYHASSAAAMDKIAHLPIELIATEVIYFVDKTNVTAPSKEQYYILKISGDQESGKVKGVNSIFDSNETDITRFCYQQLSISVIADSVEELDENIKTISDTLDAIAIVHVREDINLEQMFWSQLPGNFSFLRRLKANILPNTAALASLYNFPTGNQFSVLGNAVTLLRTEKGSPYFMNFHAENGKGNTCIFGASDTGKTVLTNFLLSEATKFQPSIIYLASNNDSKIFVEALEGIWEEDAESSIINPFLCDDSPASRLFVTKFLYIICGHYANPLSTEELACIEDLTNKLFELEVENRDIKTLLIIIDLVKFPNAEKIKIKLSTFTDSGLYPNLFCGKKKFTLAKGGIYGFNLSKLTDKLLKTSLDSLKTDDTQTDAQIEEQKQYVKQRLEILSSTRTALIYALSYYLSQSNNGPKILTMDNMESLLNQDYCTEIIKEIFDNLSNNNGLVLGNLNLKNLLREDICRISHKWLEIIDTKIILPSNKNDLIQNIDVALQLDESETQKFNTLALLSRMFLLKTATQTIALELSISTFTGMVRILSCTTEELSIYDKIRQQYPGHPNNWLSQLHKVLDEG